MSFFSIGPRVGTRPRRPRRGRWTASVLVLALVAAWPALPAPGEPAAPDADELPARVVAALEGVVSVRVREVARLPTYRNGRFHIEEIEGIGAGSGVVVSSDGLVLTNAHVVAGSAEVQVSFASGRQAEARIVGLDEASDLALLRVGGAGFSPVHMARSAPPAPGTPAYVVGNRDGLGHEIVWARIGAHRRVRAGARPIEFWSEVEAPVGPGDSGGALLDAAGELVGVPSLQIRYSEEGAPLATRSSGLYIPARHVRRSYQRMAEEGTVVWSWLGLLLEDPMIAESEGRVWQDDAGVLVRSVFPGGPAAEAGLLPGDRLRAIGPRRVGDIFEALDAVLDLAVGTGIPLLVERAGRTVTIGAITGPRPADPRPHPLDDFTLHTGLRLEIRPAARAGQETITFASMSEEARESMPPVEVDLFARHPRLGAILPGLDLLEGATRRLQVTSPDALESLIQRCFVEEQFVALVHWKLGPSRTLDRAHVHRKLYPFVI